MKVKGDIACLLAIALTWALASAKTAAQDPVEVDPRHYTVVFESDRVRVLRVTYGPQEKSVMRDHPGAVAVLLNDQTLRFTYPDGKTQDRISKVGDVEWTPPGRHLPEDIGTSPVELILVELKQPTAPTANSAPRE